jgi:hypothetical protein
MQRDSRQPHMLLDRIAPTYDVSSRHTIRIAATPARVYQAARAADLGRPWPVRLLMGIRVIPAWIARTRRRARGMSTGDRTGLAVGAARFTLVAEIPGEEFVLGLMGRFWTPTGGLVGASPERFHQLPPPGLVQALWNFRVTPSGTGTELSTETRVRSGDEVTRRQFGRYWRIIRLGSGVIRGSVLRHIRRMAER